MARYAIEVQIDCPDRITRERAGDILSAMLEVGFSQIVFPDHSCQYIHLAKYDVKTMKFEALY